jgi:hypothetical protein
MVCVPNGTPLMQGRDWAELLTRFRETSPSVAGSWRKIAVSNNVGHVKHYMRTPLRALVEERHFALVDGLRFPT